MNARPLDDASITARVFDRRGTLVATVSSDGSRGTLEVLVPRYESLLRAVLTQPCTPLLAGGAAKGGHADAAAQVLQPWRAETLRYLADNDLARHGLRTEVTEAPAKLDAGELRKRAGSRLRG